MTFIDCGSYFWDCLSFMLIKSFSVLSVWWLVDKWPNESVVESFTDSTK